MGPEEAGLSLSKLRMAALKHRVGKARISLPVVLIPLKMRFGPSAEGLIGHISALDLLSTLFSGLADEGA
jgi:Na+-transporting methylmalonyl-CoA/oxaloacetate decarboxylase beta subunit